MKDNTFFTWVWRFNGLMLMGLVGVIALLFAGYKMISKKRNNTDFTPTVKVEKAVEDEDQTLVLSPYEFIRGNDTVMLGLDRTYNDDTVNLKKYSSYSEETRNVLFVNIKTGTKRWLFTNNDYVIDSARLIPQGVYDEMRQDIKSISYKVIKKDTNGDKKLNLSDTFTFALSHADGTNYQEIISNVTRIQKNMLIDKNTLLLMYIKEGKSFLSRINVSTFEQTSVIGLPSSFE